jgi:ribosome-binding factor A
MDTHRAGRVSEALREELSELIGYEMSDPRLAVVDVTDVVVAPDMRHARIRVAVGGGETERRGALEALQGARRFLRRELAVRLRLFRVPELHFESDPVAADPARLRRLLKRVRKGRPAASEPEKDPVQ